MMPPEGTTVLAMMATPAVLLLANAMLILSTIQRLRIILERVRETELAIAGDDSVFEVTDLEVLDQQLVAHARRARHAHRALLSFYGSAGLFIAAIVSLGVAGFGLRAALVAALVGAFVGCALLFVGASLVIRETWQGIHATDTRFANIMDRCRELAARRPRERSQD